MNPGRFTEQTNSLTQANETQICKSIMVPQRYMKCFVVSLLLFVYGGRYSKGISSSQDANNNHDPQNFGGNLSIKDTDRLIMGPVSPLKMRRNNTMPSD